MSDALRLLALNAAFAGVGALTVLLVGIPTRRSWLPTILGLAPVLGIATCGLAASLGAMVGIDVRPLWTSALALAALAVAGLLLHARAPTLGSLSPPRQGRFAQAIELACLAVLVVLSVRILRLAVASELVGWDGWAMWGPKAHALFVDGDAWGPVFREPGYLMQHQEYPILLPVVEALSAGALGRFEPSLIDVEPAMVVVAFGWAAWALLRLVVVPPVAAAVALALTGSSPLVVNATANYADSVVAAFGALGLLCVLLWLVKGSVTMQLLAGIFLAAAASTKFEGLLFSGCAVVAAAAVARGFGRTIRSTAMLGIGVLAVPVVWLVVDRLNGPGAKNIERRAFLEPGYAADAAWRIPEAVAGLLREIAEGWLLASIAVIIAVCAACLSRLWWHALFVSLWGALALSALVVVYYSSTAPVAWLLTTSADRVVFSLVIGLATVAPLLAAAAWEQATARSPETQLNRIEA